GLFIAGFSVVFVLLGLTATALGRSALRNQVLITRLSGVLIVAMALYMLGSLVLRAPGLYQERRWHPNLSRFGPFAAPVAGVAFGVLLTLNRFVWLTQRLQDGLTHVGLGRLLTLG